jgi:hypothetical protein
VNLSEPTTLGWYVLPGHPWGTSTAPCFEVVGTFVYPAAGHPVGPSSRPWFQIRDGFAYAVDANPEGACAEPSFQVRDDGVYTVEVDVEPGARAPVQWFRVSARGRALTGKHRRSVDQDRTEARTDDPMATLPSATRASPVPVGAHHHRRVAHLLRNVVDRICRTVRAHDVRVNIGRLVAGPGPGGSAFGSE